MQRLLRLSGGKSQLIHFTLSTVAIGVLGLLLILGLSSIKQLPSVLSRQPMVEPPRGVERLGTVEVTPVRFDGSELFTVAAPTIWDRSQIKDKIPVEVRAQQIRANFNRVIEGSLLQGKKSEGFYTNFDPKTLQVTVSAIDNIPIVLATDAYHSRPFKLVSVTHLDADYNGKSIQQLAEEWRSKSYEQLYRALMDRSPEALGEKLRTAFITLIATIAAVLVLWVLQLPVRARDRRLRARQTNAFIAVTDDEEISAEDSFASLRARFIDALRYQFRWQWQRNWLSGLDWLLGWAQVAVWVIGLSIALAVFPWTRHWSEQLLGTPTLLLKIWFFTGLVNRLLNFVLNRFANPRIDRQQMDEVSQRRALRLSTLIRAFRGIKTIAVYAIGFLVALHVLNVSVRMILFFGIALLLILALGLQGWFKDWIAGGFILWEDQYAIGDVVSIRAALPTGAFDELGLVEKMTLRVTQLRENEGQLVTLPNSTIHEVKNLTRTWSQVNLKIAITPNTPPQKALTVIREIAQQLYAESEWQERMLEPPAVLGVEELSRSDTIIQIAIKTPPLQQWRVGREFRLRLRTAFDQQNIAIANSQPAIWQKNAAPANGTDSVEVEG